MGSTFIRLNDLQIELEKCSHCGSTPGEFEAQVAIKAYIDRMGESPCVACGQVVFPAGYLIRHIAEEGEAPTWHALPEPGAWCHVGISLGRPTITRTFKLHVDCAKKVLPHLDIEALKNPQRPWPSIEQIRGR